MTSQECLDLLRGVKDVAFATVDEQGRPQNRIVDVMIAEEGSIYFCTARGKDFYHQLLATGRAAVTGMDAAYRMVRLDGRVTRLGEQRAWIDRIFAENPPMETTYPGESRYILEPFRLEPDRIEFFDIGGEHPLREVVLDRDRETSLFVIGDGCIGCGTCAAACPHGCIAEGTPFAIDQSLCLRCGLCSESCPVQAIGRRR
ncbi:MAG: 4Fe-4S binding protein [Atopobiaceae bacterium]|jgi:uncharacterized pyridoxamine 5'-phosphate oxidase family protein|nr:4Fe-4S binding protein [Atopobiaceae bacterium]